MKLILAFLPMFKICDGNKCNISICKHVSKTYDIFCKIYLYMYMCGPCEHSKKLPSKTYPAEL